MTEHIAGTPDEAHADTSDADAVEDLSVDGDAEEQVIGGEAAEASQFRGRYQPKLDEAKGLLK